MKKVLISHNQDLNIDIEVLTKLDENNTSNWSIISKELDKVGIILDDNVVNMLSSGEVDEITKIFMRIERFINRLSGDPNNDISDMINII